MNKYLPIGSVVLLENGEKKVMIIGYFAIDQNDPQKLYDYIGCIYPEGLLTSSSSLLFSKDQIKEVFFEGYKDENNEIFMKQLEDIQNHFHSDVETLDNLK